MRNPKEAFGGVKTGDARQAGIQPKAGYGAAQAGNTVAKVEFCHGSVCLGNQKPTNCICPTDKK